ncbi:Fer-related kinase [Trichinella pseudospiralis]
MVTTLIFRLLEWTKHSAFLSHRNTNPTCISSLLYFMKTAERMSFERNRCICADILLKHCHRRCILN